MALVIGLTGSIATGKSTISKMFQEASTPIIDADVIAREVVEPGEVAYEKIVEHFGQEIVAEDGRLNREKLGTIVFNDETKRKELNGIIHPEIRKKMLKQRDDYIQENRPLIIMDIPLLFESGLFDYVDRVLVVYIPENIQLERLMNRDQSTEEEAQRRIDAQIPIEEKREKADAIIDNSGTVEDSKDQLIDILASWNVKNAFKSDV